MTIKDNIIKLRLSPGGDPEAAGRAARAARPVPRHDEWIDRDIPPPDLLCGTWLSTTSRVLITGPTGLGKTMLAVALDGNGERWQLPALGCRARRSYSLC